jgi:hypothetical protein
LIYFEKQFVIKKVQRKFKYNKNPFEKQILEFSPIFVNQKIFKKSPLENIEV